MFIFYFQHNIAFMTSDTHSLIQHHPRDFASQRYVYPVVSRRSRGISVGVNLSPTGLCNFRCVYCQVIGENRLSTGCCPADSYDVKQTTVIDLDVLENELRQTLAQAVGGELFKTDLFRNTSPSLRRINDIAFSGNGEPTLSPQFADAVRTVVRVLDEPGNRDIKPVLITNATVLQKSDVADAVKLMINGGGEVWAKLDAGTPTYYKQVDRSRVPFSTIIDNLTQATRRHPIVIQTMLLNIHEEPTPESEIRAYIERLNEMTRQGGRIKLVQLYTSVRGTAEPWVSPLSNSQLDGFADRVRNETQLPVEVFYGN